MDSWNIATLLNAQVKDHPRNPAVMFPEHRDSEGRTAYTSLTYEALEEKSNEFAWGLHRLQVAPGNRVLLMIRPSLDFYALLFAVFKVGAVPVLIDPGMGPRGFLRCVRQVSPEVFIGIEKAHVLRLLCRSAFSSVRTLITFGKRWFWGGADLDDLTGRKDPYPVYEPAPDDLAAVMFTSGSTGPAKGVCYTHRIFWTQVNLVRREYDIRPGEMDLACFPLFSLFSVALGATAVIPDMDPTKPAFVDPEHIIQPIRDLPITYSFGSPALWKRVAAYCCSRNIRLHGIRRIIMAGAPVPPELHDQLLNHVLDPGAETYTPYGATESLPVANFSGHQVLAETAELSRQGKGTCVGAPIQEITSAVISITDAPIASWKEAEVLKQGEIGELCVQGDCVTREYFGLPEATALAKIPDGEKFWHRIGDVGYFDAQGRFWFCGRKSHRVETEKGNRYSIPCEAIFNQLPGVRRSALVGLGKRPCQVPAIVIEKLPGAAVTEEQILTEAARHPMTSDIRRVFFHPGFPVDIRHNAKINREQLTVWANNQH